jgi:hypothetical protein
MSALPASFEPSDSLPTMPSIFDVLPTANNNGFASGKATHMSYPSMYVTPGFKAKPDAHRMYAQDQVVIHTVRM